MKMFGGLKVSSPPLHLCWDNYHDLWVKSSYHPLAIIARKGVERPIQPLAKKHWGPLDGKGGQMDPPCVCQSLEMHFQLRFPSQCLPHARLPTLLRMLRMRKRDLKIGLVSGFLGSPLISHSLVTLEWVLGELCDIRYLAKPLEETRVAHTSPGEVFRNHFQIFFLCTVNLSLAVTFY